jgi:hypothetical protein
MWRAGWLAADAALLVGAMMAAGWRRGAVPGAAAGAALLVSLLGYLGAFARPGAWQRVLVDGLPHVAVLVATYVLLGRAARDAGPRRTWPQAREAIARIASSLRWRMWLALAGAGLGMLALGFRSAHMVTLMLFVVPLGAAIATVVGVVGRLELAAVDVDDAPRLTLYLAAGAELWWLACGAIKLLDLACASSRSFSDDLADLGALSLAGPVVALIGTALLSGGLGRLARLRGLPALAADLGRVTGGYVVALGVALALQSWAASTQEGAGVVLPMAIAGIAAMAGLSYLAAGYDRLAEALDADPPLPAARVVR